MKNNNIYIFRSVETRFQIVCANNYRVLFSASIESDNTLYTLVDLLRAHTRGISRTDMIRAIYESTIFNF